MSEVTTWVTATTTGTTTETGDTTVLASTRVTSIVSDRPDVSVLRDLLRALDRLDAPNRARVTLTSTRIVVEWIHGDEAVSEDAGDPREREVSDG